MRFSFLVAAEFFFSSLIFVGFAGCLGFEDIKSELTTFFLEKENTMKYDDFKCRKDSPSGLLLNAYININGEINHEYGLLLCLEEFMYAFRSFFEDRIKGEEDQQDLFDEFCKYVAEEIKSDNKAFDDNIPADKRKKACDVLFLNLCKLFFIDKENDVWGDVRYFRFIFKLLHNDQEQIPGYLKTFISQIYQRLKDFVDEVEKLKKGKFKEFDTPGLFVIDYRKKNPFLRDLLFSDTEETLFKEEKLFTLSGKKTKEIFYLNNSFTSGKLMYKEIEEGYAVLIYDDFVAFENKESGEEIVWKRERKNRATPYSFYRLLSENEIREIDIFAKNPDKKVIDVLEKEIKEQMLYDFNILCSQITEFISFFKYPKETFESILKECACYVKEKHPWGEKENIGDIEKKIKSYFMPQEQRRDEYVVYPSDVLKNDYMLTEELWLFLSLVEQGFYKVISNIFNTFKDDFRKAPWFKGLKNLGNSCYINALSQNLFDYEKEMQDMVNDTFLGQMHQLQRGENKGFSKDFAKITEYDGTQQDSHELFKRIFIPKSIEENEKMMPYATKTSIKEGNKQRKGYNSFLFRFDSKFECLEANAIKEEGGNEDRSFKSVFNANKKKEFKSIHDVLNCIYDYLNTYYCNLSLFYTTIDTYCDHKGTGEDDCCKKYDITITKSSEIEVDSYEVYNGLDLLSCLAGKRKEKISGSCDYYHQGKDVDIYREQTYHNFSDFLVIHLKRFTSDNNVIPNSIPIPDNICFDGDRYDITGLVCHSGGTSSGHYIAYKKKFGLWFKFNDSEVSIVGSSLPDEAVKCAYMLFFKKSKEIKEGGKKELKTMKENDIRSNENYKIKRTEEERRMRKQEEERKKTEELEKNKSKIFLSELLQYYSLFNTQYFEIKNKDGKTFVEYLQNIVKEKNEDLEKQPYASLLLQVQKYFNLRNSIRVIDRNSNKLNEIHEEKINEEELENLEKDIIMLICKDPNLRKFYEENNMRPFLKEFVKMFFISFCDFDNTCEKPLFKKENLQSLKEGAVEFFFKKDKNINIPDDRDLPFFLITTIPIKDQQNGVGKNNFKEGGETMPARNREDKYYCFWSDKLIIAQDKKKQENDNSLLNTVKNEINEDNKINMHNPQDVDDDYGSFENLAVFKRTSVVRGCGFFERIPDEERKNYFIPNIVGEVRKEREKKLNYLLSFIDKIEKFIEETEGAINECQEKIKKEDQNFFTKKKDEIKTKYNQQIEDLGKCIDIADEYKKILEGKLQGFKKDITQTDAEIKKVEEQKKDILGKLSYVVAPRSNTQSDFKSKSKTQVFEGKKKKSIQPEADKSKLEGLEKKLKTLYVGKNSINDSIRQVCSVVSRIVKLIKDLKEEKKELGDVLQENENIDFKKYKERLNTYFFDYERRKKQITFLGDLKKGINAVLNRGKGDVFQSLEIKNINFDDIINPFNSYSFDLFVSTIKGKISENISKYLIFDLYEYLCFGKETCKRVLVGSEQRFKGLENLENTCYINSILQNLVEFKGDLEAIKNYPKDKGDNKNVETIHDEVFRVLAANRIGLHNVLNISITNGLGNTGDPAEVYSSLMNYYINEQYRIEVVEGSDGKDFVYESLEKNSPSSCNAKLILPGKYEETKDTNIINYLYNNKEFNISIEKYIPLSQGPCVFKNTIKRKYCEKCKKKVIKIEIECSPYCMINIGEFIGKANNISEVVKETFDVGIVEEQTKGIDCDDKNKCKGKSAIVKRRCCYRVMNNCLCFNFVILNRGAMNFIEIEDKVKVGDDEYELVCACYYTPGHYIAFKKINDTWFEFNDATVSPIIYKSLPKMYKGYKPTLVFYKKKIKDKK